jgi:hypothetical protein
MKNILVLIFIISRTVCFAQSEFESTKWINDSVGCNGYRNCNLNKVFIFLGDNKSLSYDSIVRYLGHPNIEKDNVTSYNFDTILNKYNPVKVKLIQYYILNLSCENNLQYVAASLIILYDIKNEKIFDFSKEQN